MRPDEKWPHMVYEGSEYQTGPDNGCWFRWCSLQLGVCVGPVDRTDQYGNRFCHQHDPAERTKRRAKAS